MRVLMLVENNAYPMDFRVKREAEALSAAGYEVSTIAPRGDGQSWRERVNDVEVYRFPAPPGGNGILGYAFEFAYATAAMLILSLWVAASRGVDAVHAANPPDTLFVIGAVFRLLGKKFVFDQHDLSPETYLSRFDKSEKNTVYHCLRLIEKGSYMAANVVISTNESYREIAMTRGEKHPDQVFIVRNGPPASYQPVEPDEELRSRAKHLIGYIGTIGPQDGLDHWVRAIDHIVNKIGYTEFLAVVIGDGDALPDVKKLAAELGVSDYVLFTGRLGEFESRKHLSGTTVCVQPDGMSPLNDKSTMNKLMEYMALGKPTVAFDLTETRVTGQDAAVYVTPTDVGEFAENVVALLEDPERCRTMGEYGQSRVSSALAWEYSVPQLQLAYSQGLGFDPSSPATPGRQR